MVLYSRQMKGLLITNGCLAICVLLLTSCGRGEVKSYRVAKPETQADTANQAHPSAAPGQGHGHPAGAPASLKYTKPEKWEETPPGEMRAASFKVTEGSESADVGVFPLPGVAGGDLGNVNRWRGQVGLEAITEADLAKAAEQVDVGGGKGQLYEMAGTTPGSDEKTRILAVIYRREGMAWFFKMTGGEGLVAAQKPSFISFLKSVQFVEGAASEPGSTPELPPSPPPVGGMTAGGAASAPASSGGASDGRPQWTVPPGWTEAQAGQFLAAKFLVTGENAEAAVNVSVSQGEGGGVAGNVNRWRGQLGLDVLPPEQLKLEKLATDAGEATLADLTGKDGRTGKPARVVGVIVPNEGRTWFYKLMGDEKLVEREKDSFIQFLKTAKY